ncbi:MAG: sigma 54-interacting transcriptional regulator [Myxococcota bacterium]
MSEKTIASGTQVQHRGDGPALLSESVVLHVLKGPEAGTKKTFAAARITVGAGSQNDLPLTDRKASRAHCEIVRRDSAYFIRDRGSTNGTFVNESQIVEGEISPGGLIRVGRTEISFEPKKKWERVPPADEPRFGKMVGDSATSRQLFGLLGKVARTSLSCVLLGETGTGKDLAARAIHDASERSAGPFVVVDCGAVTANLVESELFGHEKGAFTGADRMRAGAFEIGDGGTIFLDEIGELPLDLQPKLLRTVESREVRKVGSTDSKWVDVRILCATHRPLADMVGSGEFREDLYYRLAEVVVTLPPLRERIEDLPIIARKIIEQESRRGSQVARIHPRTINVLTARDWPGNVRELRNVLRRAASFAEGETLMPEDLNLAAPPVPAATGALPDLPEEFRMMPIQDARARWVEQMERQYLTDLMERCEDDVEKAAEVAGIHRKSLRRLLRQHRLIEA